MNRNGMSKTILSKSVGIGRNRKVSHDEKYEVVRSNEAQTNLDTNSMDEYEEYMFLGVPVKTKKIDQPPSRTKFTTTDKRSDIQERFYGNNFDSRDCSEEQNEQSDEEYEEYMFLGVPIKTKKVKQPPPETTDYERNNPDGLVTKLESRDSNEDEKMGDDQEDTVEQHKENDLNAEEKENETNEEEDQSVETVVTDTINENEQIDPNERNEENDQNECDEELDESLKNNDDDQDIRNEEKDRGVENEKNEQNHLDGKNEQNEENNYDQSEQQKVENEAVSGSTMIPRTEEYNHDVISTQKDKDDGLSELNHENSAPTSITKRDNTITEQEVKEEDDVIIKIGDSIMAWFVSSGSTAKSQTTVTRSAIDKSKQTQEQHGTVNPSKGNKNRDNDKLLPSDTCSRTRGTVPVKTGENDKQLSSDACLTTRDTVPDISMYDFVTERSVESDQMYSYSVTDSILTQMKSFSSLIEGDPEEYLTRFHPPPVIQDSNKYNKAYTPRRIDNKKVVGRSTDENRILELETRLKLMEEARIEAEVEARLKAKALQEEEAKSKATEEARIKDEMESQVNNLFLGGVTSFNDEEEVSRLRKNEEARIQAEAYARLIAIEEARIQEEEALRAIVAEKTRIKTEEDSRVVASKKSITFEDELNTRDAMTKSSNKDRKTKRSWMSRFLRLKKPTKHDMIENERGESPDLQSDTNNITKEPIDGNIRQDTTVSMFFGPDKQSIGRIMSRSSIGLNKASSIDIAMSRNESDLRSTQLNRSGSNLEANRSFSRQPSIESNVKSRSFTGFIGTVKEEMDETDGANYVEDLTSNLPNGVRNYLILEHLRPFSVFLGIGQTNAFTIEVEGDTLFERIKHNLKFFYLNYMVTTAIIFLLTLLIYPGAIIGMVFLGLVWVAVLRCMSRDGGDKVVSQKSIMIFMSGISSLVLFFLLKDIFWWALGLALVVVGHHAVFRDASMYSLEEGELNDYVDFGERDEDESVYSNDNGDRLV